MTNSVTTDVLPAAVDSIPWPTCQWRNLVADPQHAGLATCSHRRVRTPGQLVNLPICETCSLRLTESPPPLPDPPPRGCCGGSPSLLQKGWNVAVAVTQFLADGARTLPAEDYQARLTICETCDRRRGNTCTACGCNLTLKARGRAFQCPQNKWPVLTD